MTRICFKRCDGFESLDDIRLRYQRDKKEDFKGVMRFGDLTDKWFIDLEMQRVEEVLAAMKNPRPKSVRHDEIKLPCEKQRIHGLFHDQLHAHRRMIDDRGEKLLYFRGKPANVAMTLKTFMHTPLVINGVKHHSLQTLFDRASIVLDRKRDGGLQGLPCFFGLGNGHGGNLLIKRRVGKPALLYTDYETADYHTPFLDIVQPLSKDALFDVAYADRLYEDLTGGIAGEN